MRLILIRHGETEHNRDQLTLGRADVPLNALGRAQARAVAASFTRRPEVVISSPLSRALATARGVAVATGADLATDDGLIEMDVGQMEHLTGAQLRESHPDFLRQWVSPECPDARMPGGETLREVQDRAWTVVERLQREHPRGDVVAVTHNFVILMLLCKATNLPIAEFRRFRQALAARTVIDVGERGCMLVQLNDQAHLLAAGVAGDLRPRDARA